jgi:hypothetical protein
MLGHYMCLLYDVQVYSSQQQESNNHSSTAWKQIQKQAIMNKKYYSTG